MIGLHQRKHAVEERRIVVLARLQAQLGAQQAIHLLREGGLVAVQRRLCQFHFADQRQQGLAQRIAIPVAHLRLIGVGIAALLVRMVADVFGIERFHEAERAVIERQAQDRHIVRVHHAMHEAHGLPVRDHVRRAHAHFGQQGLIRICRSTQLGVEAVDDVIGKDFQLVRLLAVKPVFERAEAHETGRHARDDSRRFHRFAQDALLRTHDGQRARGGNAQRRHGFRAQEFADGRAQHGAPVAHARVRRGAGAFQLQLQRAAVRGDIAQQDGAAIAQLAGPDAELVARIHGRQGQRALGHGIADQQRHIIGLRQARGIEADQACCRRAGGDKVGCGQGRGHQPRIERGWQCRKGIVQW